MLELADIDIERGATQMPPVERIGERILVDDLAARDVDENAALFHQRKALLVEEARCLRGPLAAHDDEIALRQHAVEFRGAPQFAEARRQSPVGRVPTTRIPSAAQSRPTSSPIPPAPTTHAVLPSIKSGR